MNSIDGSVVGYVPYEARNFVGRSMAIEQLLIGLARPQRPESAQLVGFRGIGTTALLRFLAYPDGALSLPKYRNLLQPPWLSPEQILFFYLDFNLISMNGQLALTLLRELQSFPPVVSIVGELEDNLFDRPVAALLELLSAISDAKHRIVFLFDHFERIMKMLPAAEATSLRPLLSLASIITATERPLIHINRDAASSWFGSDAPVKRLGLLTTEEAWSLLSQDSVKSTKSALDDLRELKFLSVVGCHPGMLVRARAEWQQVGLEKEIPRDQLASFLRYRLYQTFEPDFDHFWRYLSADRQEVLLELVDESHKPRLTTPKFTILRELEDMGLVISNRQRKIFRPFSQLWSDFVTKRAAGILVEDKPQETGNVSLTPYERALIDFLTINPNRICSYSELLWSIWRKPDTAKNHQILRQTVLRIRQKYSSTGNAPGIIVNHRNKGYEFRTYN